MSRLTKPYPVLLALLIALSFFPLALPAAFRIDESKDPFFETFPLKIGNWEGAQELVDERTYEILETRNILSRVYKNPSGDKVHLLLVGSYRDRRVAHPPEVCYLSSNFVIVNEKEIQLEAGGKDIPLKSFLAKSEKNPQHQEHVFYFYKLGNEITTSYYSEQFKFAWNRLLRKTGAPILLIRVSGAPDFPVSEFLKPLLESLNF